MPMISESPVAKSVISSLIVCLSNLVAPVRILSNKHEWQDFEVVLSVVILALCGQRIA